LGGEKVKENGGKFKGDSLDFFPLKASSERKSIW